MGANPTPPEYGAIPLVIEAFREIDFRGQKCIIMRDVSDLKEIGMDNSISSMRIQRGPNFPFSGCRAVCYEHPNFEGRRMAIPLNNREYKVDLRNMNTAPENFSNLISSIKIVPVGAFRVLIVIGDSRTSEPAI